MGNCIMSKTPESPAAHGGHRHGVEGGTITVGVRLPVAYVAALDLECASTGKKRSDIMRARLNIGAD